MKKNSLDTIAEKPGLTFGFTISGNEIWRSRKPLTEVPVQEGRRTVWQFSHASKTSDELIMEILRMNPGMELQVSFNNGKNVCFALHLNGQSVNEIKLTEEFVYTDFCICYKEGYNRIGLLQVM